MRGLSAPHHINSLTGEVTEQFIYVAHQMSCRSTGWKCCFTLLAILAGAIVAFAMANLQGLLSRHSLHPLMPPSINAHALLLCTALPVGGVEMTLALCSFSRRCRKTSMCKSPRKLQRSCLSCFSSQIFPKHQLAMKIQGILPAFS